jgi:transcriptional regulator with XRE-family HTH domain
MPKAESGSGPAKDRAASRIRQEEEDASPGPHSSRNASTGSSRAAFRAVAAAFKPVLEAHGQGCIGKLPPVTLRGNKPKNPVYPKELETIGDHIREKRLDLGLRQADVALRLGVDLFTLINWEKNKTEPVVRHWPAIVSFLRYCPYQQVETFGDKLRLYRIHQGLSHKAIAEVLGVDPGSISLWATGERKPTTDMQRRIVNVINGNYQRADH